MRPDPKLVQQALPGFCLIEAGVASMAAADGEARGAIFTRREVVDFILDLVGYTADKPLHLRRLLEPSVGQGDFLAPAVERLLVAYRREVPASGDPVADLAPCIRAVELHHHTYQRTHDTLVSALLAHGFTADQAATLARTWLHQGDFLLLPLEGSFSHVIGNPPYVRQELIPDALMAEYRRRFHTIYDRADIYIPFIQRSLMLLASGGVLGFICADRWMKNRYGGPLRRFVADGYRLRCFVDMVDTNAFLSEVVAYPGIVVIGREQTGTTRVAFRPRINAGELHALAHDMTAPRLPAGSAASELAGIAEGDAPWMLEAPAQLALVRRLEAAFPTLEETGCNVGIGVATGADQVFIGPFDDLAVEPDRKLPLVTTRDIQGGTVQWRGLGVINPFGPDGKLVPLAAYPKLAAHLEANGAAVRARHVSKKNPAAWYRTIDRIYPELARVPKLLVPDIKGEAHIVYEDGELYPHHNLYFITASEWNLRALQAVLLSDVTRTFIELYSTKMRGGYLRFQAQYLRRLRLPHWVDVPEPLQVALAEAGKARDLRACNDAIAMLYGLTQAERDALAGKAKVPDAA